MKILISTDTFYPQVNGASYFSQRLAYSLRARGHEVYVIAPSESLKNTSTVMNGVRVFGVRSFPVFFYPKFRFCFLLSKNGYGKEIIDALKPDIIHIQGHFSISRMILKIAEENNISLVATNHFMPENLVHYLPLHSIIGTPVKKIAWNDFSKIFKRAGVITTPTATAARLIQSHFDAPIIPISCGIDLRLFNPKNNGEYLKERYGIGLVPVLLYVGRLDKEKSLDMVIRSLALALKNTELQLVIAGSGAEKNSLIKLSEELGIRKNIVFTGFVPDKDLPNLYAIADCFIIAGTAELQSIVTMEAMATGLPVLAVNAVALPELVKDNQNGFLFREKDTADLAQKMHAVFSDAQLRNTMGKKSLELIAAHNIDTSMKKFEDIYTNELQKHDHHKKDNSK